MKDFAEYFVTLVLVFILAGALLQLGAQSAAQFVADSITGASKSFTVR